MDLLLQSLHALAAVARRLSARLDPVRLSADARRRPGRRPQRSAPATSARPTCCAPATRALPPLTLLLDALKGTAAVLIGHDRRPGGVAILARCWPGSPPSSAMCFRSGSVSGGKGVATYHRRAARRRLARARSSFAAIWLLVAASDALFVAVGPDRRAGRRPSACSPWATARRRSCSRPVGAPVFISTAPTSAVSRPERSEDRCQGVSRAGRRPRIG